jgi:pilus assembly protein Flp/PilA
MSSLLPNLLKPNRSRPSGEKGQGLVEYALILVLVAMVCIIILAVLGPALSGVYCNITITFGGTCTGGHLYDSHSAQDAACTNDGGILLGSPTIPANLLSQGYIIGHDCTKLSTGAILWTGFHK